MTQVTGIIKNSQQQPLEGCVVRFTLENTGLDSSGQVYLEGSTINAITDYNGYFSVQLWPNSVSMIHAYYKYEVFGKLGELRETQYLYIPNLPSVTVSEALRLTQSLQNPGVDYLLEQWKNLLPKYRLVTRKTVISSSTNTLVVEVNPNQTTNTARLGTIRLAKAYEVYAVETDKPARVCLYSTPLDALKDAGRPVGSTPQSGLVLEVITSITTPRLQLSPVARGADLKQIPDSEITYRIEPAQDGGEMPTYLSITALLLDASDFPND